MQEKTIALKVTHVILMLRVLTLTLSTRVPVVRASMEMGFIVRVSRYDIRNKLIYPNHRPATQ